MALADISRLIATHGLAGVVGVALWHALAARPAAPAAETAVPVVMEDRREAVNRRARELADEAATSHDRWTAGLPKRMPTSPREAAEDALARRGEILAKWQAKVDALKRKAAAYQGDGQLMVKIEDLLFRGEEEDVAAMVLALFWQDESRAFAEMCRREALHGADELDQVFEALPEATLERWVAGNELPLSLRRQVLSVLGQRMGRNNDLDGLARAWANAWRSFNPHLLDSLVDEFTGEWICTDPPGAVRRIFHEWPEELRRDFLEQLEGVNEPLPIWTAGLADAMRQAPWGAATEDLRERLMDDIEASGSLPEVHAVQKRTPGSTLPEGMGPEQAREEVFHRVDRLLEQGPDLLELLADGRIAVDEVARSLAGRLPGPGRYPEELAEVVFKKTVAADPVGALKYAEGKFGRERLEPLSGEALRVMAIHEPRVDRMFEVAALLPLSEPGMGSLREKFLVWRAWAPDQAAEALGKLPVTHPLRTSIEAALSGKEEP